MIKAVVFDMGGVIHTLAPSQEGRLRFAREAIALLKARGVDIGDTPEEFDRVLLEADKRRKARNEETLVDYPPLESWVDYYLKKYGAAAEQVFPLTEELCFQFNKQRYVDTPRPGLKQCMQSLREQGMRLGVISNTLSRTYAFDRLASYDVAGYFEYVLLSSVCGLRKPGREIFELLEQTMGLKKEELAYVGDTISRDVIGVRNAGWALMIRISRPDASAHFVEREGRLEHLGYQPDYTIEALPEVADIIREYNRGRALL